MEEDDLIRKPFASISNYRIILANRVSLSELSAEEGRFVYVFDGTHLLNTDMTGASLLSDLLRGIQLGADQLALLLRMHQEQVPAECEENFSRRWFRSVFRPGELIGPLHLLANEEVEKTVKVIRHWDHFCDTIQHMIGLLVAGSGALELVPLSPQPEVLNADGSPSGNGIAHYLEAPEYWERVLFLMRQSGELPEREALLNSRGRELLGASEEKLRMEEHQGRRTAINISYWQSVQEITERFQAFYDCPQALAQVPSHARTGPKPQALPASRVRLGTSEYFKDVMMGLHRGQFVPTESRDGVFTQIGNTQLCIECDDASGFDALRAVELLATYGPATMQTFLGLMGLWLENNTGATHETYYTARASDLMRYMHRRESGGGGYNTEDQMQKGREVYLLSRAAVPHATSKRHRNGKQVVETISLDRLIHVQSVTAQRTLEEGKEIQSILEFRYHPNKEMHEMLCGDTPQFAEVSGKLLAYHPVREKYQIVIGFGLAFYDRVNRKHSRQLHKIDLPSLLTLAGIEIPAKNVSRFLEQIQAAVEKLDTDGVVSGARLHIPQDSSLPSRQQLAASAIVFPPLALPNQSSLPS